MKKIKTDMIAPCGINCSVCLKQFKYPVACDGCNSENSNKPDYCYRCIIRNCKERKNSNYCFNCDIYPCKRLKQLDRRYCKSYNVSLLENLQHIKENGIKKYIKNEKIKWTCPSCGKLLCVHRKHCLHCEKQPNSKTETTFAQNINDELQQLANKDYAARLQKYFKTGKGEYGEGDKFLGVKVPLLRKLAKKHKNMSIDEAAKLLTSSIHEERLISLFLLLALFKRSNDTGKNRIFKLYLNNTKFINNWDLVDCSAGHIVGAYLFNQDKKTLYALAKSNSLWERRISIMATSYFINENEFTDTLNIAEILLHDQEDLIHKAVGWMLREIGLRDLGAEECFLRKHYNDMPRTMLRYAIEKFPKEKRKRYLKGLI